MNCRTFIQRAMLCVLVMLTACEKKEALPSAVRFDPPYIAAEADKGNLAPLVELNAACSAEVKKSRERLSACHAQDEVRKLSKPIHVGL
jgi:hypothetical protein